MGNLLCPRNNSNLVQGPNLWTQSSVHAQNTTVYDRRKRQEVEHLAT